MLSVAAHLSAEFNFIRVDLYSNGHQIYAGELTNCHGNARECLTPPTGEKDFARLLFGAKGFHKAIL
jgi:hypothetical protein